MLLQLPNEMLCVIASYLGEKHVRSLSQTCSTLHKLINPSKFINDFHCLFSAHPLNQIGTYFSNIQWMVKIKQMKQAIIRSLDRYFKIIFPGFSKSHLNDGYGNSNNDGYGNLKNDNCSMIQYHSIDQQCKVFCQVFGYDQVNRISKLYGKHPSGIHCENRTHLKIRRCRFISNALGSCIQIKELLSLQANHGQELDHTHTQKIQFAVLLQFIWMHFENGLRNYHVPKYLYPSDSATSSIQSYNETKFTVTSSDKIITKFFPQKRRYWFSDRTNYENLLSDWQICQMRGLLRCLSSAMQYQMRSVHHSRCHCFQAHSLPFLSNADVNDHFSVVMMNKYLVLLFHIEK